MTTLPSTRNAFAVVWLAALALILSAGCASATQIPMRGSVADMSALAGEWLGTYTSPDVGRQGTIWFKLAEGEDHAHGDVRMTPRGSSAPLGRHDPRGMDRSEPLLFLSIRFVRVTATDVDGHLEQYWDPDFGCLATTVFRGRLYGDRLEGTFETRLAIGIATLGRWQATRKIYR